MSARDKLKEANFFFEKLSKAQSMDDKRYYFSAFISAWRSVTYALQKDYKSKYGEKFNDWYEKERQRLRAVKGAGELLKIRTIIEHEGNKYPQVVLSIENVAGDKIDATWDMSRGKEGLVNYGVTYANGPTFPIQEGEIDNAKLIGILPKLISEIPSLIEEIHKSEVLFTLGDNFKSISIEDVLQICRANLDAVSATVEEAEKRFGLPSYDLM